MIRRDGFLNFTQLIYLIWSERHDDLMKFEPWDDSNGDAPSVFERRQTFVFWVARLIIDNIEEVALIDGNGGFVRVDAACVFFSNADAHHQFASDLPIQRPITRANLANFENRLSSDWEFVIGIIGIVKSRRSLWERVTKKDSAERARLRKILLPFHGWTVTINEKYARAELKSIALGVAANLQGADEIEPLEYVYQCFISKYPQGKGPETWSEVEKTTGYSRRHIIRAIKAFGGQNS